MLSKQEEQRDRYETLINDKRVRDQQREQGSAYIHHVEQPAGGRFAVIDQPTIVGLTANPQYPAASAPFQHDPVPDEPPLGFDNPALGPEEYSLAAAGQGPASAPGH